jgi:predicted nucleic acid-binding Zn ribbon protein
MICNECGGTVEWQGKLTDLTHTKCLECGALNTQKVVACEICTPTHEHIFDGKVWYSEDGRSGSVTCSICGLPEIFWDQAKL